MSLFAALMGIICYNKREEYGSVFSGGGEYDADQFTENHY